MSPAAMDFSASITHDGGSSGSLASKFTASSPSAIESVPALRAGDRLAEIMPDQNINLARAHPR